LGELLLSVINISLLQTMKSIRPASNKVELYVHIRITRTWGGSGKIFKTM